MDSDALLELAVDALPKVFNIAISLGVKNKNGICGMVGSELCILTDSLQYPRSSDHMELYLSNFKKLLGEIERVCTWHTKPSPTRQDQYRMLRALTQSSKTAEATVLCGLEAFASAPERQVNKFISHIRRLYDPTKSKTLKKTPEPSSRSSRKPVKTKDEYPSYVNKLLYEVLYTHLSCTCLGSEIPHSANERHLVKLRLIPSLSSSNDHAFHFDVLFSRSPLYWHWQDVQLLVLSTGFQKRKVQFAGDEASSQAYTGQFKQIETDQFCHLVSSRLGSRLCLKVQDEELWLLNQSKPREQNVLDAPSITLSIVLEEYRLTARMKAALAYILARSIWQFYDSYWMNTVWTSESIHFLKETMPENGLLYAWKPYFSVRFDESDSAFPEFSDSDGKIHRYPKLLALGIMLIEIGMGSPIERNSQPDIPNTNTDWLKAIAISLEDQYWQKFDYPRYRGAVASCLDHEIFASAPFILGQTENEHKMGLDERRNILYDRVVCPLEDLLTSTGWLEELVKTGPVTRRPANSTRSEAGTLQATVPIASPLQLTQGSVSLHSDAASQVPLVLSNNRTAHDEMCLFLDDDEFRSVNNDDAKYSDNWFQKLNERVHPLIPSMPGQKRIKIAILDTGIQLPNDASVLYEGQIIEWKSWLTNHNDPKQELQRGDRDLDGHGTHCASLLLKVAKNAAIYVARVFQGRAETRGDITAKETHGFIAEAITHAVNTWNVDIISMSFGCRARVDIINEAITDAYNNNVLMFAAASNCGGNDGISWPADSDKVICVHATDGNGNPTRFTPNRVKRANNFATPGSAIKSYWPDYNYNGQSEMRMNGTSSASPIAAGIAAILMEYIRNARERFPDVERNAAIFDRLRERKGMSRIFHQMVRTDSDRSKYHYIEPWILLDCTDEDHSYENVLHNILRELRKAG